MNWIAAINHVEGSAYLQELEGTLGADPSVVLKGEGQEDRAGAARQQEVAI